MTTPMQTIFGILQTEDRLVKELHDIQDEIVCNLYIIEESKDPATINDAKNKVDNLREREDSLKSDIGCCRRNLRHRLLKLFE